MGWKTTDKADAEKSNDARIGQSECYKWLLENVIFILVLQFHKPDLLKAHSDMAFLQGLLFFFFFFCKAFYLDEQMLSLYMGKPLLLGSSSSVNNKYGSIVPFSRISSCGFWLGKDGALRIAGNDALKPLVIQSCAWL